MQKGSNKEECWKSWLRKKQNTSISKRQSNKESSRREGKRGKEKIKKD